MINWGNKEEVLSELLNKNSPYHLGYASERLQDDKDVVLQAVKINGANLQDASKRLRGDTEVISEACKNWRLAYYYADKKGK